MDIIYHFLEMKARNFNMKIWYRYMAAADLCSEIMKQGSGVQLEEGMEKKICSAFIAHLNDKSLDVQGNAVKCI